VLRGGGEADEVVGLVSFFGVGLRVKLQSKSGFGGWGGHKGLDFGECDLESREVWAL
jgi:hypothetical protein